MAGERDKPKKPGLAILLVCIIMVRFKLAIPLHPGEELKFSGIPYFAPELFRRVRLKDPLTKGFIERSDSIIRRGRNTSFSTH